MAPPIIISPAFLLWSQSLLLWSAVTYAFMPDPLQGEMSRMRWSRWLLLLSIRAVVAAGVVYALSYSFVLSIYLFLTIFLQPLLRHDVPMRMLAEFESFCMSMFMVCSFAAVHYCHLSSRWTPAFGSPAQLAALCILLSTLFVVVRGGTYIVRGVLKKSGTFPTERSAGVPKPRPMPPASSDSVISIAASVDEFVETNVDIEEYNRGRLIGNLERIVLTIVVAAGSYAALAFLVAAKGVVRSDEFNKNRDFAEYFLIGSLSSVLVALCAGMALRYVLIRLWPDLLSLQMQ
jgi:hypothetical protein